MPNDCSLVAVHSMLIRVSPLGTIAARFQEKKTKKKETMFFRGRSDFSLLSLVEAYSFT